MNQNPDDDFDLPDSDDDLPPELSAFDVAGFDPEELYEGQDDDETGYPSGQHQTAPGRAAQDAHQAARQVGTVQLLERLQDNCAFDDHVKILALECGLDLERGSAAIGETFRQLLASGVAASQAGSEEEAACLAAAAVPIGLQLFPTSGKRLFPLLPVLSAGLGAAARALFRAAEAFPSSRRTGALPPAASKRSRGALQVLPLALFRTLITLHQRARRGEVLDGGWAAQVLAREIQRTLGEPEVDSTRSQPAPIHRSQPASSDRPASEPPGGPRPEKDRPAPPPNGRNGRKPGARPGPSRPAPAEW